MANNSKRRRVRMNVYDVYKKERARKEKERKEKVNCVLNKNTQGHVFD